MKKLLSRGDLLPFLKYDNCINSMGYEIIVAAQFNILQMVFCLLRRFLHEKVER